MTEKKKFPEKGFTQEAKYIQKNRLLHTFSRTVTVSITFSNKNIKYWRINCKSIRLRLKTLTKNDFLLIGFQILASIKQNNGRPRPMLETVMVSTPF